MFNLKFLRKKRANPILKYFLLNNRIPPKFKSFLRRIRYNSQYISKIGHIGNSIRIEASSMCQLKCPLCPTGRGINKKRVIGWGYLKFSDFKSFIELNPYIKNIELANYGEIFLNPDLMKIIEYAFIKKLKLTARVGTNLNRVDKRLLECLVKYKFKHVTVSIDGASNDTYKIYRRGGNFEKVIGNIKLINQYKKKYNSNFPELCWQFVIMGHNEHELPLARKMAEELKMEFKPKLNWSPLFYRVRDKKFVRKESGLGVASRMEYKRRYNDEYISPCYQLWMSPQINWEGKLLGCCVNVWGDFGNVFKSGLSECLRSERFFYTKRMLLGLEKSRGDIPCSKCHVFKRF